MQQKLFRLRAFAHDKRGNVAILFGIALIPLLLAVGAAVDYGRVIMVRDRMSDAADASALAIGSWTGLTQAQLTTKAQQFFAANYPPSNLGTVGTLNVAFAGDNIDVSVSGSVPTTFLKLANIDSLPATATAVITKKENNLEVVLVLDTTGSMAQTLGSSTKISALKSAAKQMVSTLFSGQATSTTVKIGIVPFAAAVNVGADKLTSHPEWFDLNSYSTSNASADPIAFEDLDKNTNNGGVSTIKLYSGNSYSSTSMSLKNRSWAGCVRERSANNNTTYELTDAAPSSSDPTSRWVPYFAPDEADRTSGTTGTSYANNYLSDGSYGTACVKNDTSSPTDTRRQCFTGKYKNVNVSSTSTGPDFNCPPASILAMTNDSSPINNEIDSLQAKGSTVLPAGLLWGWRVISPGPPFTEGVDYSNDKYTKAIVLMTDGENDVGGGSNGVDESYYNAFGFARNGHLGSTSGSNAESTLDSKTLTVCNAVKNLGVRLYTIGLGVTSASQTLLTNCASTDNQGNKLYYNAPTSDQLASIFQDIAQGLSELRIAQ
jgi:Flp pilus assembly protein TadG